MQQQNVGIIFDQQFDLRFMSLVLNQLRQIEVQSRVPSTLDQPKA